MGLHGKAEPQIRCDKLAMDLQGHKFLKPRQWWIAKLHLLETFMKKRDSG